MPMQIGLEELLSMLVSRLDGVTLDSENQKSRFNIMFRTLWKKGLISEEDVLESVRDEHRILHELGVISKMPDEEALRTAADGIMLWVKGDSAAIRKSMEEYDKKIREAMAKQQSKIDVAPAGVLNQLDRLGGSQGGGKKLIL